jgi:xylulokinase
VPEPGVVLPGGEVTHALGIDVGTTNAKAAIVAPDGTLTGTGWRPIASRRDGETATQSPDALWAAVVGAVRESVAADPAAARGVTEIGVATQYSSIVPVDRDGRAVGDLVLYLDHRGTDHSLDIFRRHDDAFTTWVEHHGIPPVGSGLSLAHLLHFQHDAPEVHAATAAYLEPMDYVNLRLTGVVAANQGTMFAAQLCDNRTLGVTEYDEELVGRARVDPSRLPPLQPLDAPVGPILGDVADELGLPRGATVHAACNDSHAGAVATGAFLPGRVGAVIGTTSVLLDTVTTPGADLDHEVFAMPSPLPGRYLVWAENGLGGKALEHVLEHVVHAVDELGDHATPDQFAPLDHALLAVPPGSGGVLFLPWLNGSVSPQADPHVRGAFLNLSLDTGRTHLVRAVVEGICANLAWLLPVVERFAGSRADEIVFGGGAARSGVWASILADVLDRPVTTLAAPEHANARAVGLLAMLRAGVLTEPELGDRIETVETYAPDPAARAVHAARQEAFESAFAVLRPIYRTLNP